MGDYCILLKIKENRQFLTCEKELDSIVEFAKSFSAEVYRVKLTSGKVMQLKKLASAICNPEFELNAEFTVVEKLFPKKTRGMIIKDANNIRQLIEKQMKNGKPLSLKQLRSRCKTYEVTDACLCNHFAQVRKSLAKEGHRIKKTGAGEYRLSD